MMQLAERSSAVRYRTRPRRSDVGAIRELVANAGVFSEEEVGIAEELIRQRLRHGVSSGYDWVFADVGTALAGYACFGRIPLTRASFDLYWIVTAPGFQRQGIGRELLRQVEDHLSARGGGNLYIETSSRQPYEAARRFYLSSDYHECGRFADFYATGDAKVTFVKRL